LTPTASLQSQQGIEHHASFGHAVRLLNRPLSQTPTASPGLVKSAFFSSIRALRADSETPQVSSHAPPTTITLPCLRTAEKLASTSLHIYLALGLGEICGGSWRAALEHASSSSSSSSPTTPPSPALSILVKRSKNHDWEIKHEWNPRMLLAGRSSAAA
jgi:hypothetical protein